LDTYQKIMFNAQDVLDQEELRFQNTGPRDVDFYRDLYGQVQSWAAKSAKPEDKVLCEQFGDKLLVDGGLSAFTWLISQLPSGTLPPVLLQMLPVVIDNENNYWNSNDSVRLFKSLLETLQKQGVPRDTIIQATFPGLISFFGNFSISGYDVSNPFPDGPDLLTRAQAWLRVVIQAAQLDESWVDAPLKNTTDVYQQAGLLTNEEAQSLAAWRPGN
jgi:hypothetical protein